MSTTCRCGCCSGPRTATPADTWNAPRRAALHRRVGTYASFFESMRTELSSNARAGLAPLRTRALSDPAVALADAWAVAADVLTFYQERLTNEGYLRTATERMSVIEIANLIGYRPRPGVAATVHLAYTLDDKSVPVEIPAGSKAQNVPDPGEQMQTFETAEALQARVEWNQLRPRLTVPLNLNFMSALTTVRIRLTGAALDLRRGDRLLFAFVDPRKPSRVAHALRRVASVTPAFDLNVTEVELQPVPRLTTVKRAAKDFAAIHDDIVLGIRAGMFTEADAERLLRFFDEYALGAGIDDLEKMLRRAVHGDTAAMVLLENRLKDWAEALMAKVEAPLRAARNIQPLDLVPLLDRAPVRVAASAANLARSIGTTFGANSDAAPQLLTRMRPRLADDYYRMWRNLPPFREVPKPDPAPVERALYKDLRFDSIHVFRNTTGHFGNRAPMTLVLNGHNIVDNSGPTDVVDAQTTVSLDSVDEGVGVGSFVLVDAPESSFSRFAIGVAQSVTTRARNSYFLQGNSTRIELAHPGTGEPLKWRDDTSLSTLRTTIAHVRSERLEIALDPDPDPVSGDFIHLDTIVDGLQSGRWLIVSGERADLLDGDENPIPGIEGRELMMVAAVEQVAAVGEQTHTKLTFERGLANSYKRSTVRIFANVAKATHGETHEEALGSGNAAETLQTFSLKRDPLTFVPAVTPDGVQTTLDTRVNLVRWHETDTLAVAAPSDRSYVVRVGENGETTVTFGTGERGARLPTGTANVRAKYRSGIGKPGNVKADRISLLASRPLGVREVNNPLRSSGGAGAESRDQVRANAPLAVASLDRLIGVRDYADFARTFAGIGHADARSLSDGVRTVVHVTVAGIDDIPLDETSDLLKALLEALRRFGDPALPVRVAPRELLALVLSAGITIDPDYLWDDVERRVRAALIEAFSFSKRTLGQAAYLSEAIAAIQAVRGVVAVDVDVFDAVSEHDLIDQKRLTEKIKQLTGADKEVPQPRPMVPAARARRNDQPKGDGAEPEPAILPAQLAFVLPDVADTLILNRR